MMFNEVINLQPICLSSRAAALHFGVKSPTTGMLSKSCVIQRCYDLVIAFRLVMSDVTCMVSLLIFGCDYGGEHY